MDVTGAATANNTLVELYDCNGSGAQKWTYDTSTRDVLDLESELGGVRRSGASAGRSAEAHHEHTAILDALRAHDAEAADRAMRAHLTTAAARITLVLNQHGDGRIG